MPHESGINLQLPLASTVEVDVVACDQLAAMITTWSVPEDKEDTTLPGFDRLGIGNFYLALVAICHQTSPRNKPPLEGQVGNKHLRGWDYLLARFEHAARIDASWLEPATWQTLTPTRLRDLFRDPQLGERLADPEGRTALLRNLGEVMVAKGWTHAEAMYYSCAGFVLDHKPNLLETLGEFHAYRDPVRKKSLFFLSLMRNSGLWAYRDDTNLGPPVDYHEVRGHLRLGTVRVLDESLRERLRNQQPVTETEDVQIRGAVYEAIMRLSRTTGFTPSRLHYLFWNVFRSVCTRDDPHCLQLRADCTLPPAYLPLTEVHGPPPRCPFSSVCPSACTPRRLIEHNIETDYY